MNTKVAILGGGAAGLALAGFLKQKGCDVVVFDGNEKAGKKLYITGKGRCNLTNLCDVDEFLKNIVRGEKFMRTSLYNFNSFDAVSFFEDLGLKTKVERGNRVFPESDKSSDVIKVLTKNHCKGVNFRFCEKVVGIQYVDDKFLLETKFTKNIENTNGNENTKNNKQIMNTSSCCDKKFDFQKEGAACEEFDRVVIATGGKSYSATGSTGDGYAFARAFGHNIVDVVPALCPIKLKNLFVKKLQGVSLKNVSLHAIADGKKLDFFGEMMFTDAGITGPIVLTMSSFINRAKSVQLWLDFKPALTLEQLDSRLDREFSENRNKQLSQVLRSLLPKSVAEVFASEMKLNEMQKCCSIQKSVKEKIIGGLKNFPLQFGGLYPLDAGIVTSGGVDLKEVNPKTFESKLVKGLYFVGEVLDVDALTGGFNLQMTWSMAHSCAKNWT